MRYSILIILLLVLALIFTFQNTNDEDIKFLFWGFKGPLALIIILTFFVGAITGILVLAQRLYAKNAEVKRMRKQFLEMGKIEGK